MADLATERDITTVPKVELHVHLNGTITEAIASLLARRHGADPEDTLRLVDGRYPGHYPNFEGFLDSYLAANQQRRAARHSFASPDAKAGFLDEIDAWVAAV